MSRKKRRRPTIAIPTDRTPPRLFERQSSDANNASNAGKDETAYRKKSEREGAPDADKFDEYVTTLRSRDDLTANAIHRHLDLKVVGQDAAKKKLSVLFSVHLSRIDQDSKYIRSPNAVLIGSTGVGKTLTLKMAADHLRIPFITVDTTTLVPSGGVGYKIGDLLGELLLQAGKILGVNDRQEVFGTGASAMATKRLAQHGVIFFDEIDKIALPRNARESSGDNNNTIYIKGIQRALLKIFEGSVVQGTDWGDGQYTTAGSAFYIDTSGILIIAGGAFAGITDSSIADKRPEGLKRLLARRKYSGTASIDLVSFGFMEELVGRLPVIIDFNELSEKDFFEILNHDENSPYIVWKEHFHSMGKKLIFTEDANSFLVERARMLNLGARGLHQVLFPGMVDLTYRCENEPSGEVLISAQMLLDALGY